MGKTKGSYFNFDEQTTTNNLIVSSDNSGYAIDLVLTSIPVVAETRKMRAQWTPELAQDLEVFSDASIELFRTYQEKAVAKRRRYKDRKIYIKMIEEWSGGQINKGDGGINN